ncbi:unnamed protein product, partial [Strongylus vulgaris]
EKNGESEDGGEEEESHDDEEAPKATPEENGKEGENGHVESTDTNGNDRKRVSDVGVAEAAADEGAPALKKKKAEEEEVLICRPLMAYVCQRSVLLPAAVVAPVSTEATAMIDIALLSLAGGHRPIDLWRQRLGLLPDLIYY